MCVPLWGSIPGIHRPSACSVSTCWEESLSPQTVGGDRGSVVDVEIVQGWGLDLGDTRVPPTPRPAQGQWTVLGGTEVSEYNKGRCLGILAWGPLLKPGLDLLAISGNPMDRQVLLPPPCLLLCQNPGNGAAMTESLRAEPRELLCQIWRPQRWHELSPQGPCTHNRGSLPGPHPNLPQHSGMPT